MFLAKNQMTNASIEHVLYGSLGILVLSTLVSTFALLSASTFATQSCVTDESGNTTRTNSSNASVTVASACTLSSTGGGNYSATVPNGTAMATITLGLQPLPISLHIIAIMN